MHNLRSSSLWLLNVSYRKLHLINICGNRRINERKTRDVPRIASWIFQRFGAGTRTVFLTLFHMGPGTLRGFFRKLLLPVALMRDQSGHQGGQDMTSL